MVNLKTYEVLENLFTPGFLPVCSCSGNFGGCGFKVEQVWMLPWLTYNTMLM